MDSRDEFYLPEEVIEWISLKKSEYLSKLIELQEKDDFGFEEFHRFDSHLPDTIGNPDRAYQNNEEDFAIRTCVKSYPGFHQVAVGALIPDQESKDLVFVPILNFVSKKERLIQEFSIGEAMPRPTLN